MQPQVAHAPSNSVLSFLRRLTNHSRTSATVSHCVERPARRTPHQSNQHACSAIHGRSYHRGRPENPIRVRITRIDTYLKSSRDTTRVKSTAELASRSTKIGHPRHSKLSHTRSTSDKTPPGSSTPPEKELNAKSAAKSVKLHRNPPPLITNQDSRPKTNTDQSSDTVVGPDSMWVRDLLYLIHHDNVDKAEEMWHQGQSDGKPMRDLRKCALKLMQAFNLRNRWLDTIRFFKWAEDAIQLEDTEPASSIQVIKREDVGIYLAELDRRGRTQEIERQKQATVSCLLGTEIQRLEALPETFQDEDDDIIDYLESLKETASRLGRIPRRYMERSISEEELEAALAEWSINRGAVESTGRPLDGPFLDYCFKALLARLDNERLLTLFYQHQLNVKFTPQTWEYVISAYLNLGQFGRAQGILRYADFRHWPLSHVCVIKILHAVRKYGGSWEKQVRYFKWLEKITNYTVPEIYHVMVQTAIEKGLNDEAELYFSKMAERGLHHTPKSLGAILSAHAVVRNWHALRKTLELMDTQGLKIPIGSFNAVLDAYANTGSFNDTEGFFQCGLDRGIVPNHKTYSIMIKACVYANGAFDEALVGKWVQKMVDAGFKPDPYTFNMTFYNLRKNYAASSAILRRVYQKVLRMQTTHKVLDDVSKDMLLKSQHQDHKQYPWTYREIRTDIGADLENQNLLALRMASAIEVGNGEQALALWTAGMKGRTRPSFQVLVHALRACFISDSEERPISWILAEAKKNGMEIPPSIIIAIKYSTRKIKVENMANSEDLAFGTTKLEKAYERIEEAYRFFQKHGIPVTHHVTVHTANYLINAGRPADAIQLMHRVAVSKWGIQAPFDIIGTSVILKGYCVAQDMKGVKWAVDWVISHNKVATRAMMILLDNLLENLKSAKKDAERDFIQHCINKLKNHKEKLREEAIVRGELLVDLIKRTVGVQPARRYGTNWPLVTRKGDTDVGISYSAPHWNRNAFGGGGPSSVEIQQHTEQKPQDELSTIGAERPPPLPKLQNLKRRRKKRVRIVLTLPELEAKVAAEHLNFQNNISQQDFPSANGAST